MNESSKEDILCEVSFPLSKKRKLVATFDLRVTKRRILRDPVEFFSPEVIEKIFRYIVDFKDWRTVFFVSKHWYQAGKNLLPFHCKWRELHDAMKHGIRLLGQIKYTPYVANGGLGRLVSIPFMKHLGYNNEKPKDNTDIFAGVIKDMGLYKASGMIVASLLNYSKEELTKETEKAKIIFESFIYSLSRVFAHMLIDPKKKLVALRGLCCIGNLDYVTRFIEYNKIPNVFLGSKVFIMACAHGHSNLTNYFLNLENIELSPNNFHVLTAMKMGNDDIALSILNHPCFRVGETRRMLMLAAVKKCQKSLEWLLKKDYSITITGSSSQDCILDYEDHTSQRCVSSLIRKSKKKSYLLLHFNMRPTNWALPDVLLLNALWTGNLECATLLIKYKRFSINIQQEMSFYLCLISSQPGRELHKLEHLPMKQCDRLPESISSKTKEVMKLIRSLHISDYELGIRGDNRFYNAFNMLRFSIGVQSIELLEVILEEENLDLTCPETMQVLSASLNGELYEYFSNGANVLRKYFKKQMKCKELKTSLISYDNLFKPSNVNL